MADSPPVMPALYAAIEAVHEGKIAEAVIEHSVNTDEHLGVERNEVLTITVRRAVKTMTFGGETEQT